MTRRPLNSLFLRAVQCRDQTVVNRLYDRSHPNKKKEKEEEETRELGVFIQTEGGEKGGGRIGGLVSDS
ncbi:hypothetical protein N7491_003389 [Penicillium cf. griseofulvum]|uniref:Uncharacterized protein n=1 Tax=Penicillium cf. griseofulvum TaxID=2972120 RepID=A0A9W9MRB4_9EURO|nr:hypothetical protein N7472_002436 [Penicillium cf. griseofulvum]KAJ5440983.1 hypothetical protein N7491_003389 [Penicillium cf. griseofulvum]KAJ5449029.1 hypothetical protein N7445_003850 [Penicillium cf. griseofulvum]